jgi:hypothetical protein
MDTLTKKCPMCAEQIPLTAIICEYCSAKFEITDINGQFVSKFLEDDISSPKPPEQIHTQVRPIQKPKPCKWVFIVIGLLVIIVLIWGGISVSQNGIPFLATATSTPHPTATSNHAATRQASYRQETATARARDTQATAMAQAIIFQFAEPILSKIQLQPPDIEDDFSDSRWVQSHWMEGVSIENGKAIVTATDNWKGIGFTSLSSDFIFIFEFTPTNISSQTLWVGFSFRGNESGDAFDHFTISIEKPDSRCGFGEGGSSSRDMMFVECQTSAPGLDRTTRITIIVQGYMAAAYLNDQPLILVSDLLDTGNEISLGITAGNGTATVSIDNVKFWNLP